jgi:hypothetical protein
MYTLLDLWQRVLPVGKVSCPVLQIQCLQCGPAKQRAAPAPQPIACGSAPLARLSVLGRAVGHGPDGSSGEHHHGCGSPFAENNVVALVRINASLRPGMAGIQRFQRHSSAASMPQLSSNRSGQAPNSRPTR